MKDFRKLTKDLENLKTRVLNNVKEAHRETAEEMWETVVQNAPYNTGEYIASIKLGDTEDTGTSFKTMVYTDLVVGPAISTGKSYNLGFLLETGTDPHAIPNAFDWGRIYGYDSEMYKRTLDPNWHPGTVAQPHFHPALQYAKEIQKDKIRKAVKEAYKEVM